MPRVAASELAAAIDEHAVAVRASLIAGAGRGLFLTRDVPAGAVITEYAGADGSIPAAGQSVDRSATTHMLRVPDESRVIDGLLVAAALCVDARTDTWRIPSVWRRSLGALANAAHYRRDANAKLVWVHDDRALPAPAAATGMPRDVWNVLPKAAFLVATRPLAAGDEVLWWYAPVLAR